jgi:hypothetical protein
MTFAHAQQFRDVMLERLVRPRGATFLQWCIHLPVFTGGEERQLEPDAAALAPCVAVLVFLGRVLPSIRRQQCGNPLVVFQPYSDVEVVMWSRDRPRVKVDRPPPNSQYSIPRRSSSSLIRAKAASCAASLTWSVRGAFAIGRPPPHPQAISNDPSAAGSFKTIAIDAA